VDCAVIGVSRQRESPGLFRQLAITEGSVEIPRPNERSIICLLELFSCHVVKKCLIDLAITSRDITLSK
jgi:hypothetical protein